MAGSRESTLHSHAARFNNDTTPCDDEDAAKEAWRHTLVLFDRRLRCTTTDE